MLMPTTEETLELGFMLTQQQWGKGLATEVCKVLIDFTQADPKIKKLTAKANAENEASLCCLEKLGFKYQETISASEKVLGGEIQLKVFSLKFR